MSGRIDYEWIKQCAKAQGVSVSELIVLAPQNDPFYTGTPSDWLLGEWFAQVWQQLGEARAHLRRVHYYLVSVGSVALPNGKPYENTMECWDVLNAASKAARYLGLVDPGAFVDRRTPEVMLAAPGRRSADPRVWVHNPMRWAEMQLPAFPELPKYGVAGYVVDQPYHLEVWCEKSTMNDVLIPLCERYGANLQTGMGEMSITATLALVRRLEEAGKPARILYVSDFDPAGQSMPVAVSRKMEYFVRTLGLDLDIQVFSVVLTVEQVQYYQLPRTPIKETERRRAGFEERFGGGAVELDALEALHAGDLEGIVGSCLEAYYDGTLEGRVRQRQEELQGHMSLLWQQVIASYQAEVAALRVEYERVQAEYEPRMGALSERVGTLWQAIKQELHGYTPVVQNYPQLVAYQGEGLGEGLYESGRGYMEQVEVFKQFQGR